MKKNLIKATFFLFSIVFLVSCKNSAENLQTSSVKISKKISLVSSSFKEGETIGKKYTGEGEDLSPPLKWSKGPEGTKSFVIICDDPDAPGGMWDHWILFNIKPDITELKEGIKEQNKPDGSVHGRNSWGRTCYNGPMPPKGREHRYFFRIYALDIILILDEIPDKKTLLKSMEGHLLGEGQLMGIFKR